MPTDSDDTIDYARPDVRPEPRLWLGAILLAAIIVTAIFALAIASEWMIRLPGD